MRRILFIITLMVILTLPIFTGCTTTKPADNAFITKCLDVITVFTVKTVGDTVECTKGKLVVNGIVDYQVLTNCMIQASLNNIPYLVTQLFSPNIKEGEIKSIATRLMDKNRL